VASGVVLTSMELVCLFVCFYSYPSHVSTVFLGHLQVAYALVKESS
jgi:hypothetical protein